MVVGAGAPDLVSFCGKSSSGRCAGCLVTGKLTA